MNSNSPVKKIDTNFPIDGTTRKTEEVKSFARPTSASAAKVRPVLSFSSKDKISSKDINVPRKQKHSPEDSPVVEGRSRAASVTDREGAPLSKSRPGRAVSVASIEEFMGGVPPPSALVQETSPSQKISSGNQFMKNPALKQKLKAKLLVRSKTADTLPLSVETSKKAAPKPFTQATGATTAKKGHIYGISVLVAGTRLWCAGDQIRVYDVETGNLVSQMGHTQTICMALVGNQVWSGGSDKLVHVWDSQTGEKIVQMSGHEAGIKCLLADQSKVFSGSLDGCICIWNAHTMQLISHIQAHTRAVNVMIHVGSSVWSASDDRSIRVLDAETFKIKKRLQGHSDYVKALASIRKNFVCSASEDTSVVIWDAKTFNFVKRIQHPRAVKSLVTVNGYFLSGSSDGTLRQFSAKKKDVGNFIKDIVTSSDHPFALNSLFAVTHLVWCAFVDQSLMLWDSKKDKILATFKLSEFRSIKIPKLIKKKKLAADSKSPVTEEEEELKVEHEETHVGTELSPEQTDDEEETMEEDTANLINFINGIFQRDPEEAKVFVPVDTTSVAKAVKAFRDGVLLSKLINKIHAGTIDLRVLNIADPLNLQQMRENLSLCINAAKSIGCQTSITPDDFLHDSMDGQVLRFIWQLVEACLFAPITNGAYSFEDILDKDENLRHLPPEEVLMRWVNRHLQSLTSQTISNFSSDLKDSVRYSGLMKQLGYSDAEKILEESDLFKRANAVVQTAAKKDVGHFIMADDIVEGRTMMNMAFVLELFKKWSNYHDDSKAATGLSAPANEGREARSIEAWLNSFGVDPTVTDVNTDLRDGVVLLQVFDKIHPGKVDWRRVVKSPENKWKRMENCEYAVQLIKDVGVPLKGIVGTDIEKGDPGLTLALCWQLMSHSMLEFIKNLKVDGKEVTEKDLMQWANERVPEKVRIESFRDASLKNGQFLLYLLDSVEPGCIHWKYVHIVPEFEQTDDKNKQNAKYIVSVAWKLGMKNSFISWQDIAQVKGKTVELFVASVMIYVQSHPSSHL